MKAYTDYPIKELGDKEWEIAPVRECKILSYDNDKYCKVQIGKIKKEIKICYIYPKKGRCGKVKCITSKELINL